MFSIINKISRNSLTSKSIANGINKIIKTSFSSANNSNNINIKIKPFIANLKDIQDNTGDHNNKFYLKSISKRGFTDKGYKNNKKVSNEFNKDNKENKEDNNNKDSSQNQSTDETDFHDHIINEYFKQNNSKDNKNSYNPEEHYKPNFEMKNKDFNIDIKNLDDLDIEENSKDNFTVSYSEKSNYIPEGLRTYSLKIVDTSEIDNIIHNEENNGVVYKYGIPVKNSLFKPRASALDDVDEEASQKSMTPNERMMDMFELDKDSSYESLVLKYNEVFNNELDMYGNVVPAGETYHEVFKEDVPIPMEILKDEPRMKIIRRFYRYNVDIPGNVKDVNPMKFVADLKPIEEFRYTPICPIPEKDIKEHKIKVEEKRRKGQFLEIDKKRLYHYFYACIMGLFGYYIFNKALKANEKNYEKMEKLRFRRYRYIEEDDFY